MAQFISLQLPVTSPDPGLFLHQWDLSRSLQALCSVSGTTYIQWAMEQLISRKNSISLPVSKSKSKSKKTLFKVGQYKQTTLALTWSEC